MRHVLAESLRFDEDVEVGLLQLLREHGEDARLGAELCQMIHDQLQQQLEHQPGGRTFTPVQCSGSCTLLVYFYCKIVTLLSPQLELLGRFVLYQSQHK